jgi:hypothetical protein
VVEAKEERVVHGAEVEKEGCMGWRLGREEGVEAREEGVE